MPATAHNARPARPRASRRAHPPTGRAAAFARSQDGSVTVDWTVLAAAATALVMATGGVLLAGLAHSGGEMNEELFDREVAGPGYGFDFGPGEWAGAETARLDDFGAVLGPIAGSGGAPTAWTTVSVPPDIARATFSFDVVPIGGVDGADLVVHLGGQEIGRVTAAAEIRWSAGALPAGVSVSASALDRDASASGDVAADDPRWDIGTMRVTVSVDDPADAVTFGLGSTAPGGEGLGGWGIDDWTVSGDRAAPAAPAMAGPSG